MLSVTSIFQNVIPPGELPSYQRRMASFKMQKDTFKYSDPNQAKLLTHRGAIPKFGMKLTDAALLYLEKSCSYLNSGPFHVCFSPGSIEKINQVPHNENVILVCKRQDSADNIVVAKFLRKLKRETSYLVDSGYFADDLKGKLWRMAGALPAVRGGDNSGLNQKLLDIACTPGKALMITPEGQLSFLPDDLLPFQKGIGDVAYNMQQREKTAKVFPVIFKYQYVGTGNRQAFQSEIESLKKSLGENLISTRESEKGNIEKQLVQTYQSRVRQVFNDLAHPLVDRKQIDQYVEKHIRNFETTLLGRYSKNPHLVTRLNRIMGILQREAQNPDPQIAQDAKEQFLKTRTLMMMLCFPDISKLNSGPVSAETLGSAIQWLKYDIFDDFVPVLKNTSRKVTVLVGDPISTSKVVDPEQFTELMRIQMVNLLNSSNKPVAKL